MNLSPPIGHSVVKGLCDQAAGSREKFTQFVLGREVLNSLNFSPSALVFIVNQEILVQLQSTDYVFSTLWSAVLRSQEWKSCPGGI